VTPASSAQAAQLSGRVAPRFAAPSGCARHVQQAHALPESLVKELREWRMACPKGDDELGFPNLEGAPMSPSNLTQRGLHRALRRAGLRKIRFHDLRHNSYHS
jgi:integrase